MHHSDPSRICLGHCLLGLQIWIKDSYDRTLPTHPTPGWHLTQVSIQILCIATMQGALCLFLFVVIIYITNVCNHNGL